MFSPPPNVLFWHPISCLTLCLKLLYSGQHSAVSSPLLCEETERWPPNKFPFNVQTSKSTCPRCFVCLLPLSGPHPLIPVISLSALKQTSLPDTKIYTLAVCVDPWKGQGAEMRESYHMCKMSRNSCPSYSAASFIKCALKVWSSVKKILQLPHAVA